MKPRVAIVLCLVSLVAVWGVAGAVPLTDENGSLSAVPGNSDPSAVAEFPAPVERTGQKASYGPRDDGRLRRGVSWPNPRFTDNGNGTVTDNLTGLIWLKNANCISFYATDGRINNKRTWKDALRAANLLGTGYCGLTDGSVAGEWRLPNIKELSSLIDFQFRGPPLSDTVGTGQWSEGNPFSVGQLSFPSYYWSSTSDASNWSVNVWIVDFYNGEEQIQYKYYANQVWPVRGERQEEAAAPGAPVEKTGQMKSYGPRDDGRLREGVSWPNPRFTDNNNGTVRDNLTGLIWLKDAGCKKFYDGDNRPTNARQWFAALASANKLSDGYCGLTDGSVAGQWRLPNIRELQSLVHFGFYYPAIPDTAGTGQLSQGNPFWNYMSPTNYHWSSTTTAANAEFVWIISFYEGLIGDSHKTYFSYPYNVWPVRGPE